MQIVEHQVIYASEIKNNSYIRILEATYSELSNIGSNNSPHSVGR
jgi:hypothetical protein